MSRTNRLRRIAAIIREMNDAVRLLTQRRLMRDLGRIDLPPGNVPEFLLRTAVAPVHEPTARQRAAGRRVR